MKTKYRTPLFLSFFFLLGFQTHKWLDSSVHEDIQKGRVTGIGGVFFKCKDPQAVRAWYQKHLGINTNDYGAVFEFRHGADSSQKGFLQWSPFNEKTKYFNPSDKDFMINYRVMKIENLVTQLKEAGVLVLDTIETFDYGKFVHIMDLEGNKVELWEPNDLAFETLGKQIDAQTNK